MKKHLIILSTVLILSIIAFAGQPAWWTSQTSPVLDTGETARDHSVINQGQLKNITNGAYEEIEDVWDDEGGAGAALDTYMASISTNNNYYVANIGQAKFLAAKFYDRFIELELAVRYPWDQSAAQAADHSLVNIGQVKWLFSFDVPELGEWPDRDGDGLNDADELAWFGDVLRQNGTDDYDGDGVSNSAELAAGTALAASDTDGDGLSDSEEATLGTDPLNPDSDGDGLPDGWENANSLDPDDDGTTDPDNGASGDPDSDGRINLSEYLAGTDPKVSDVPPGVTALAVYTPLD